MTRMQNHPAVKDKKLFNKLPATKEDDWREGLYKDTTDKDVFITKEGSNFRVRTTRNGNGFIANARLIKTLGYKEQPVNTFVECHIILDGETVCITNTYYHASICYEALKSVSDKPLELHVSSWGRVKQEGTK